MKDSIVPVAVLILITIGRASEEKMSSFFLPSKRASPSGSDALRRQIEALVPII